MSGVIAASGLEKSKFDNLVQTAEQTDRQRDTDSVVFIELLLQPKIQQYGFEIDCVDNSSKSESSVPSLLVVLIAYSNIYYFLPSPLKMHK